MELESLILNNLIYDEKFVRTALPHIKPEYFEDSHRVVYNLILDFITKYNKLPNASILKIEYQNSEGASRGNTIEVGELIHSLEAHHKVENDWLLNSTEKWCKDRAIHLAIMESITIIDGKSTTKSEGHIPDLLNKALSVTFDTSVGHDYIESADARFDFYHRVEDKIEFDLEMFNEITGGGIPRKTLNIILAGTGCGKSLGMCHMASAALNQGRNVLYITLEMSEERIAERIDANLLDVRIDQLKELDKSSFDKKINTIAQKTRGRLVIKEYPTASAHVGHFRALLHELKMKKKFVPDIIFIDYLNICTSSRIKGLSGSVNTYSLIKSIAEEIRGLAVEFNVPIWSATQVTRSGFSNSDVDLTDTSESFGLPATCDLMVAFIKTEQLDKMSQILVKQLKNRYNDLESNKRFTVGIDRSKMRLYDVSNPTANIMSDSNETTNNPVVATPFTRNKKIINQINV
jgi:replicative DNA helicase